MPVSFKDIGELTSEEKLLIRDDLFAEWPVQPFVTFTDEDRVGQLFGELVVNKKSTSSLLAKAQLLEILELLIRDNFPLCLAERKEQKWSVAANVKEYIDAGQGMGSRLEDLAKQFAYSKYYLEREFKREFGVSLMAYRNQRRMEHARRLLEENRVSDVARELGFSSIYAFSRAFSNHFGYPPSKEKEW